MERLIYKTRDNPAALFSEILNDGAKLLASCDRMCLEGIGRGANDGPYRSGPTKDWIKVKSASWREANKNRGDLFNKEKRR